jgi:hypothetical protein
MGRVIEPPREQFASLRTSLTPGEASVFEFFDRMLPEGWEIYVQPHLNGLRPDFVLLNPATGIAVFEVKDWGASQSDETRRFRRAHSPLDKVKRYKHAILNLYCPRLGFRAGENPKVAAAVTAGVIIPTMATDEAILLLDPSRLGHNDDNRQYPYYPIAGGDALETGRLEVVFPDATRRASLFMSEQLARDFRTWLREPDYATAQRQPLALDNVQKRYVTSTVETQSGYRRVKGPAGSGKSVVLAARAAWLTARKKDVLVVTYNITLWHYLRDLAVRHPEPGRSLVKNVTWDHFHQWCSRVICLEADMKDAYDALWRDVHEDERDFMGERQGLEPGNGEESPQLTHVLEVELPALTAQAIEQARDLGTLSTYDAILIDEGQDFTGEWWNVLRQVLRPGGEMWLFADDTQGLYGRSTAWTDAAMHGAGFRGSWSRLEGSYRLPRSLVPELDRFVRTFLSAATSDPPTTPATQLSINQIEPVTAVWRQIDALDDGAAACVQAVLDMPCIADPTMLAFTDVTLLVSDNKIGLESVRLLEKRDIKVAHTFDESKQRQRDRKLGFFMGDGRVKATTIHSFKGWETRALVVYIPRAVDETSLKAAYVGLTRLKAHSEGSYLTVVCAASELEAFGRTMPKFQDYGGRYSKQPTVPTYDDVPF